MEVSQCITLEYDQHDNLSDVASHALRLFDEGEPFSICAFSMGGMMAFELLAHVPEQIEKIALLDSNAHADKSQGWSVWSEHLNYAVSHALDMLIREQFSNVLTGNALMAIILLITTTQTSVLIAMVVCDSGWLFQLYHVPYHF